MELAVRSVAVVGGTHGNERHGVELVRWWQRNPHECTRSTFTTKLVISNSDAAAVQKGSQGVRYVDTDLNRCFKREALAATRANGAQGVREAARAVELDDELGPKHAVPTERAADFVVDLHNTTSNVGVLLCLHRRDRLAVAVAAFLQRRDPTTKVVLWGEDDPPFLPSTGRGGFTLEVGPVAHGTVNARLLARTRAVVCAILDFFERANVALGKGPPPQKQQQEQGQGHGEEEEEERELVVFESKQHVDYPKDEDGNFLGFVHPSLQGIDELSAEAFVTIGTPMFWMLDGTERCLSDQDCSLEPGARVYPVFVNEAAYYEKGVAMMLVRKAGIKVSLPKAVLAHEK